MLIIINRKESDNMKTFEKYMRIFRSNVKALSTEGQVNDWGLTYLRALPEDADKSMFRFNSNCGLILKTAKSPAVIKIAPALLNKILCGAFFDIRSFGFAEEMISWDKLKIAEALAEYLWNALLSDNKYIESIQKGVRSDELIDQQGVREIASQIALDNAEDEFDYYLSLVSMASIYIVKNTGVERDSA